MLGGHGGHVDHGGDKGDAMLISVLALVLAFSETLGKAAQIAIVIASASVVTAVPALAWLAGALGIAAIAFCVIGFWFPAAAHLF